MFNLVDLLPPTRKKEIESEGAYVLVVRKGIDEIVSSDELEAEQKALTPDKQFYHMYQKKMMTKRARYNLCFAEQG